MWGVEESSSRPKAQIPIFFEKQTHTREGERGSNTKAHHNSTQKPW